MSQIVRADQILCALERRHRAMNDLCCDFCVWFEWWDSHGKGYCLKLQAEVDAGSLCDEFEREHAPDVDSEALRRHRENCGRC